MGWVDHTPLWIIGLSCMAVLALAHEVGYRAGRGFFQREGQVEGAGYLVASAISLTGLLMAFTFGAAQSDFRLRQELVATEANAIGSAYLLVQVLEPPARGPLSQDLLRYAEVRATYYGSIADPAALALNEARTSQHQARIWALVGEAVRSNPVPTLNPSLLQSVNEMFDTAEARGAARDIRVPPAILLMLVVVGVVSAALMGFTASGNRRYPVMMGAVLFVEVLAFCLILALDRPNATTVRISQRPLERTVAEIRQSEALKASRRVPAQDAGGGHDLAPSP